MLLISRRFQAVGRACSEWLEAGVPEDAARFAKRGLMRVCEGVPTILGVQPTRTNRGCSIFRLKAWDSLAQGNALGFWQQSCTLKGCDSETYAVVRSQPFRLLLASRLTQGVARALPWAKESQAFSLKTTSPRSFPTSPRVSNIKEPSFGKSIWETPRMVGTPSAYPPRCPNRSVVLPSDQFPCR